jgi:hypothetical protein
MNFRKDSKISFLEQDPLDKLLGAKFPLRRDVFRHFYFNLHVLKKDKARALRDTAGECHGQADHVKK